MNLMTMNRKRRYDLGFSNQEVRVCDFKRDRITAKTGFGHIVDLADYTRASDARMANTNGTFDTFAAHDVAQTNLGMKVSPQVENLLKSSLDYTDANWVKTQLTIDSHIALAPDGSMTGSKLVETNQTGYQSIAQSGVVSGTLYTLHTIAKAAEISTLTLWAQTSDSTGADFDLSAGVVGHVDPSKSAKMIELADGWWWCILTFTATATTSAAVKTRGIYENSLVVGGEGLFIWNSQLEVGAYASEPVISDEAAVGVCGAITVYDDVSGGDLNEFTLFAEVDLKAHNGNGKRVLALNKISGGSVILYLTGANELKLHSNMNGDDVYGSSAPIAVGAHKIIMKASGTNAKAFMDGVLISEVTLIGAISPTDIARIYYGSDVGGDHSVIDFKQSTLFDNALTDAQCLELTI